MYGGTAVSDADREAVAAQLREHYAAAAFAWMNSRTGWTRCTGHRTAATWAW